MSTIKIRLKEQNSEDTSGEPEMVDQAETPTNDSEEIQSPAEQDAQFEENVQNEADGVEIETRIPMRRRIDQDELEPEPSHRNLHPKALIAGILFLLVAAGAVGGFLIWRANQKPSEYTIHGVVEKGPFLPNSNVAYQELKDDFTPMGDLKDVALTSNTGGYTFKIKPSASSVNYVQIVATGSYFDEVKNKTSDAPITLKAIISLDKDANLQANVNAITTMDFDRISTLIKNNGMKFAEAQTQAEKEILTAFGITDSPVLPFTQVSINTNTKDAAMLLSVSSVLADQKKSADVSVLMSKISTDVQANGKLESDAVKTDLKASAAELDADTIRKNLSAFIAASNGVPVLPPLESYYKALVDLTVATVTPADKAAGVDFRDPKISICFNQLLNPDTVNPINVQLVDDKGATVSTTINYKPTEKCIGLAIAAPLKVTTKFTIKLTGVKSQSNNTLKDTSTTFNSVSVDLKDGLVEHYLLNGSTDDASGFQLNANAQKSEYRVDRFGNFNSALNFPDSANKLSMPLAIDLSKTDWTISEWFAFDAINPSVPVSLFSDGTYSPLEIYGSGHTIVNSSGPNIDLGKWYNVIALKQNGRIVYFINGVKQGDGTSAGGDESLSFSVSAQSGAVDDFRLYKRALNPTEIDTLYQTEKANAVTHN